VFAKENKQACRKKRGKTPGMNFEEELGIMKYCRSRKKKKKEEETGNRR
jgi:hypothetical protein